MTLEQGQTANIDLITVTSIVEEEIAATHADVTVAVSGASFFAGNMALKKAREIVQLIADLEKVEVKEDAVDLRGVRADVSTGSLGNKTSSATYSLRIINVSLSILSDVVSVITNQKNTTLGAIVWRYGDTEAFSQKLLESALRKAQAKAQLIAKTFDLKLLGVHSFKESTKDGEPKRLVEQDLSSAGDSGRSRARRSDDFSMGDVSHRKWVSVEVSVQYRISSIITHDAS